MASGSYRIALGKDFQEKAEPIMVVGSYSSLSHCLLNLIKNAREAMPDGGTIHILWEGNETTATVTVRDHGAGISEQDLAHIFEPFYSTKKQGTGLGLAMVRGIVGQHAGTVEIRSTLGMGTSVSLVWPRGEMPLKPAQGEGNGDHAPHHAPHLPQLAADHHAVAADARRNRTYTIYVIDDDDLVRDGLCSLLEHLGHRTHSFRHPEVALQTLLAADPRAGGGHCRLQHAGHERHAVHQPLQHHRDRHAADAGDPGAPHERPAAQPLSTTSCRSSPS